MSENNENNVDDMIIEDTNEKNEDITLSPEQYNALLDRLSELESIPQTQTQNEVDIDSLAAESQLMQQQQQQQQEEGIPVEDMDNVQLTNYLINHIDKVIMDVQTEVQTLKIIGEIDKCEAKHEDFWDYEKQVYELASKNPTLSIEQAYNLAKGDKPPKDEKNEKNKKTKTEKLLNLPSRGEKGTTVAPSSTVIADKPISLKEAAAKAWGEVNKG